MYHHTLIQSGTKKDNVHSGGVIIHPRNRHFSEQAFVGPRFSFVTPRDGRIASGTSTRTEDDRAGVDPGCRIRSDPSKRTMMLSSRHTRLALALLAMLIAALAHPAAAQSVAKIPTRHVEGGDAVAALALPRRPLAPLVNDATIVDQDTISVAASTATDGPAPRAAMGEAQETPALHPMRPMRPADATTTAAGEAAPALTPIRPAVVDPTPAKTERAAAKPDPSALHPMRPLRPMRPVATTQVANVGLDESRVSEVDAVQAVAAAEVALEKAEEATDGVKRDPEAQSLLHEAERVLAKAEMEAETEDGDAADMGGREMKGGVGAGGSGAGMENNREYDRWYSTTPPWVLATCAGVGAGLVLIVFQTVCQGVNRGCEGAPEVRSLATDDYAKPPPPSKYGAAGTAPV